MDSWHRLARFCAMLAWSAVAVAGCTSESNGTDGQPTDITGSADAVLPTILDGPLDPEVAAAVATLIDRLQYELPSNALHTIDGSGDARLAWVIADVMRFVGEQEFADRLTQSFTALTGFEVDRSDPWSSGVDQLMLRDIPAPPDYFETKRTIFAIVDDRWDSFFDPDASIDWRHVGWGGVFIDDRPLGDPNRCTFGCIAALDDPAVTDAAGGDWYPDDRLVFGVVVDGEARAYPKHIMEVHEMVNDTLGQRRIGVPYCTLCGSAQAYLTDEVVVDGSPRDASILLRTSGLLIRSNKMMFDLETMSLIDTFTGVATSGPLRESAASLQPVSVVTAPWGEWKRAHPETTIVASDGGVNRTYEMDPLGGRDDDGPIFPIGQIDPRLGAQIPVLGVLVEDGRTAVAFPADEAMAALKRGDTVAFADVVVMIEGGGLRAVRADGSDAGAHEAFWFAWSQFHPGTELWSG